MQKKKCAHTARVITGHLIYSQDSSLVFFMQEITPNISSNVSSMHGIFVYTYIKLAVGS